MTSRLIATVSTITPKNADFYVALPRLSRFPYLVSDFAEKLRAYVLAALDCGFVHFNGASAPNFVNREVVAEAGEALELLNASGELERVSFPCNLYIEFTERRLLEPVPYFEVVDAYFADVMPEGDMTFMVLYPREKVDEDEYRRTCFSQLHARLAADGLHGNSRWVKLFNADYLPDSRECAKADRLTSALHDALDGSKGIVMDALFGLNKQRKPLVITFAPEVEDD